MGRKTTIQVDESIKARLDKLKLHPREPYSDVIKRLLEFYEKHHLGAS
jgi:predicted CopG family antitoxin